jgi:NhaP-type Na+/H+ or K+/H+ antiporter
LGQALATILSPTDAALGKVVVSSEDVPAPLAEALNVESGLNDGICVPLLAVLLSFSLTAESESILTMLLTFIQKVGIGVGVGGLLAYLGQKGVLVSSKRNWMHPRASSTAVPALAFGSFAMAEVCGGSGFIACFVGGLLFGALCKEEKHQHFIASDAAGDALSLITWVIFGAVIVGQCVGNLTWTIALYAVLSLTLIRMLPVILSLSWTGLPFREKAFIGWFGPRGLASIVFIMMVSNAHLEQAPRMASVVMTTIILSILLHGLTANPLVKRLKSTT